MSATNIIELRRLLAEKFPGVRTRLEAVPPPLHRETGWPRLDALLPGGLPEGAMTEVIASRPGAGSALMMRTLLNHAAQTRQIAVVIDGRDSLDVTGLDEGTLSRLLWVRCHSAAEAMQAADLVLRDGNLSLVLLDLAGNPAVELQKIPATTWYRFQRLVEETSTVCLVFTPRTMVVPAQMRITLQAAFTLGAIEQDADVLLENLRIEIADSKQQRQGMGQSMGGRKIA